MRLLDEGRFVKGHGEVVMEEWAVDKVRVKTGPYRQHPYGQTRFESIGCNL